MKIVEIERIVDLLNLKTGDSDDDSDESYAKFTENSRRWWISFKFSIAA